MITQGNATDASQAVHLKNSQRADVLLHNSPCFSRIQQHSWTQLGFIIVRKCYSDASAQQKIVLAGCENNLTGVVYQ